MDPILSNSNLFPSFFQALPNYSTQCLAIIQLLRHYNWTWIGVITSDDDFGEKQSQELKTKAANYEICVEYIIKIYDDIEVLVDHYKKIKTINKSTSQVIVICGTFSGFIVFFIEEELKAREKTFIVPAGWIAHFIPSTNVRSPFHGSLVFSPPVKKMPDRASCHKCPEDQWPNDFNQCVPKPIEFLSYENDPAVLVISVISVLCFLKTSVILGIFILFQDTPVVQANNKTMSFILLVSIMLSFLCVFLFLDRPTHVTCMLRQTSFGIIFSVAISSLLAKTIMVYTAFKASKPGSSWRRLIGVRITNCVVFFCSFIQVLLSIIWLSTSPPFPEMNTHLYQDKIIFQCNEGSMVAFSMLLSYMGLLAAISFIVAFLARNLPDSFNEAKNITFSMLVVCSVWVAFIPSYMSVTGKNTVLVEIFAVISSSVGILGCIFFPKCYIILVRPELNSKCNLSSRIKANTKGM
ncbi:vomeronasal type-2 receptor 26-like [Ranitomeya variabilis]|uniref:vomeronasal type-2 receptor 26-like n=1 Tax=Ranitomeya variabilis TaxID=490064 RepID=UPI00405699AB